LLTVASDGDDFAFRAGVAEQRGDVVAHLGEGVATLSRE
jgi:hypothetical protein